MEQQRCDFDPQRHGQRGWLGRKRSEEHTSELQSRQYLVCRLLLEKKIKRFVLVADSPPYDYHHDHDATGPIPLMDGRQAELPVNHIPLLVCEIRIAHL